MNAWQNIKQFFYDFWLSIGAFLFLFLEILSEIPEFTYSWKFYLFLFLVFAQIINTQMKLSRLRNTRPNVVPEDVKQEKPFLIILDGRIETDIMVERYFLPFRNTKLKGIRLADTDPIHAIVSFYNLDCIKIISHEKPFWVGSRAPRERPLEYKVILEANGKPEGLFLIAKQQGMRPLYVFSDDSYIPGRTRLEPFRDELELPDEKYYICVRLGAGNLDVDPVWILLTKRGENEQPDFKFTNNPCKTKVG